MTTKKKATVADVIAQLEKSRGNLSAAAKALKISRMTIYRMSERHASVQEALDEAREQMLDEAESVLYDKVLAGETVELLFFLKTQGKKRGYVERIEQTGKDGQPIQTITRYAQMSDEELDGRIAELESQRAAGIPPTAGGETAPPD